MKFIIRVKRGIETLTVVRGVKEVDKQHLTIQDVEAIRNTEAFLEKLTGFRFHIFSEEHYE